MANLINAINNGFNIKTVNESIVGVVNRKDEFTLSEVGIRDVIRDLGGWAMSGKIANDNYIASNIADYTRRKFCCFGKRGDAYVAYIPNEIEIIINNEVEMRADGLIEYLLNLETESFSKAICVINADNGYCTPIYRDYVISNKIIRMTNVDPVSVRDKGIHMNIRMARLDVNSDACWDDNRAPREMLVEFFTSVL